MLKGFHCPYGQGDISFADCLEHAKTDPPECGFVHPILAGIVNNIRGEIEEITVTQLLNCLRKVVLERRHDHYVEPQQLYYAFRGQMFHQIASGVDLEECVVEQRFKREVAGITISGQPDLIVPDHRKLYDFKTARRIPRDGQVYANHCWPRGVPTAKELERREEAARDAILRAAKRKRRVAATA